MHAPVELKRFYVDKPWQGQGLARTLMEAVEQAARARAARASCGWASGSATSARRRSIASAASARSGTQIFVVGTDPQTDHVMLRELE